MDGLSQRKVNSAKEVFKLMKEANQKRTSHGTQMNELSSRSHLILQLVVTQVDDRDMSVTVSKMSIVDLAGSERVKDSKVSD